MNNFLGFTMVFSFVAVAGIIMLLLWLWSLVDCIRSDMRTSDKILWTLMIVLLNIIGSLLYFLFRKANTKSQIHPTNKKNRLVRSSDDRILAGVCAGIGDYFRTDPAIIRVLWVLLTIFSVGTGILLYLIAAVIMPSDKPDKKQKTGNNNTKILIISAAVVFIILILGFTVISIVAINHYHQGGVSVSRKITTVDNLASDIAKDHIKTHQIYQEYGGYNLFCSSVRQIQGDVCEKYKDPYGFDISNPRCFSVHCKFDVKKTNISGFTADAVVVNRDLKSLGFRESQAASPLKTLKDTKIKEG